MKISTQRIHNILWDTMKVSVRGKFRALSTYIKKMDKSQTTHPEALEQKDIKPKRNRRQEIN